MCLAEHWNTADLWSSLCSPLQYCFGELLQLRTLWLPNSISPHLGGHQLCLGSCSLCGGLKIFSRQSALGNQRMWWLMSQFWGILLFCCTMFSILRTIINVQVFSCFLCEGNFGTCYCILIKSKSHFDELLII